MVCRLASPCGRGLISRPIHVCSITIPASNYRQTDTSRHSPNKRSILQGVSIACYAEPCISYVRVVRLSVCPFVCLFVTRWHCVKTTQAKITKSSPTDSPRTLVLAIKSSSRNSRVLTPREGVTWEWGRKNSSFQQITCGISETVQDRTTVAIDD